MFVAAVDTHWPVACATDGVAVGKVHVVSAWQTRSEVIVGAFVCHSVLRHVVITVQRVVVLFQHVRSSSVAVVVVLV